MSRTDFREIVMNQAIRITQPELIKKLEDLADGTDVTLFGMNIQFDGEMDERFRLTHVPRIT